MKGDKTMARCMKAVFLLAATEVVGVLRRGWRGAFQPKFWTAFARKARQTRMGQRNLTSLVISHAGGFSPIGTFVHGW